jgi:hypothetical protein
VVVVGADVVVVVELNGAALVVVVVVEPIVVVVVLVGKASVVVEVEVEVVEVVEVVTNTICKGIVWMGEEPKPPILNSNVSDPRALVKKLVLARYFVPPTTEGTVSVNKGPCVTGVTDPVPDVVT